MSETLVTIRSACDRWAKAHGFAVTRTDPLPTGETRVWVEGDPRGRFCIDIDVSPELLQTQAGIEQLASQLGNTHAQS
jgi:hypothetical protein